MSWKSNNGNQSCASYSMDFLRLQHPRPHQYRSQTPSFRNPTSYLPPLREPRLQKPQPGTLALPLDQLPHNSLTCGAIFTRQEVPRRPLLESELLVLSAIYAAEDPSCLKSRLSLKMISLKRRRKNWKNLTWARTQRTPVISWHQK